MLKGVVLAGGTGSRLNPLTKITNKHLLPVYDKPMIYYPIETLVNAGIRDILVVTGGENAGDFLRLLANGKEFGLSHVNYTYQEGKGGIAEALSLAQHFADDHRICVILGDDQHESFQDDNMPAFCVYYGESVDDAPRNSEHRATFGDAKVAKRPDRTLTRPTDAALGEHLIEALIENEFDVTRSNKLPVGRREGAIGHAFYYVYRRLMDNHPVPSVPLMVNTYFPPNAPTAKRCYDFGAAVGQAIKNWDSDKRVAIVASGGLSHTVIEEDLDARILDGLRHDDKEKLLDYADVRFRGGTSEIKNWIALGGAVALTGLRMDVVDYVPCYRTEAGNGCAMGFAEWV